jgi:hypothetical protein
MPMAAEGWTGDQGTIRRLAMVLFVLVMAACDGGTSTTKGTSNLGSGPAATGGAGSSAAQSKGCPGKALVFAAPSPWAEIGSVPSNGASAPEPIYESKLLVSNPNPVDIAVEAKTLVEAKGTLHDFGGPSGTSVVGSRVATFGVARPEGGNRIDGKDIRISTVQPLAVPAGRSLELVARVWRSPPAGPVSTKVVYGRGRLVAPTAAESDACDIAVEGAEPMRLLDGVVSAREVSTACPDNAVQVTGAHEWTMVKNFAGQQTWQGTLRVTNTNATEIHVSTRRSFALVTVTRADGTTFSGYSGPLTPVLPAAGDTTAALVLPGRTVELTTDVELVRPTKVVTAQTFVEAKGPAGTTCTVAVTGAQAPGTAARGPKICADGVSTEGQPHIDIGVRQSADSPVCR